MADDFKLPDIGEGLAEGEIVKWLVGVGDTVAEDQPLVEVMTDKATVEIPSPRAGTVAALTASEGEIIAIGTTILVFGEGGAGEAAVAAESGAGGEASGTDEAAAGTPADAGVSSDQIEQAREIATAERRAAEAAGERKPWEAPAIPGGAVAPAARRLAAELGVDVSNVPGSGRGGLVTKEDVRAFADGSHAVEATAPSAAIAGAASGAAAAVQEAAGGQAAELAAAAVAEAPPVVEAPADPPVAADPAPEPAEVPAPAPAASAPATSGPPSAGADVSVPPVGAEAAAPGTPAGAEERIPLRGLRRTISERMVVAKTTVPHYTYVEEVDMTEIVALRQQAKPKAADHGVKLTYLPFIIHALVLTLRDHPYLNASLDEDAGDIVLKRYYNVGIATNTERGLMVPVIKGADQRDLFGLAAEITRLSDEARDGKISLDDLHGGTFTITSTGNIGGFLATPVINLPEVAILGVTAIRERPVVRDGEIVIRQMMNLSLSCDHRVVDGAVAAVFMRDLVRLLEDPKLQLLASL